MAARGIYRTGHIEWSQQPTSTLRWRIRQASDGSVLSMWTDEVTARRFARGAGNVVEECVAPPGVYRRRGPY